VRRSLALFLVLLVAASARAGIVIKNNGKVFVGAIEDADVTSRAVTMHSPRVTKGSAPEGLMTFDRKDVRWFDKDADEPTDAYFKRFLELALDPPWEHYRDEYKEAQKTLLPPGTLGIQDVLSTTVTSKSFGGCLVSIHKPRGWSVSDAGSLLVLESEDRRARIHVFASDISGDHALKVARSALERFGNKFDREPLMTGTSLEWLTTFERGARNKRALRKIVQTTKSTAFAVAYASESDFEAVERLARRSFETFKADDEP